MDDFSLSWKRKEGGEEGEGREGGREGGRKGGREGGREKVRSEERNNKSDKTQRDSWRRTSSSGINSWIAGWSESIKTSESELIIALMCCRMMKTNFCLSWLQYTVQLSNFKHPWNKLFVFKKDGANYLQLEGRSVINRQKYSLPTMKTLAQ